MDISITEQKLNSRQLHILRLHVLVLIQFHFFLIEIAFRRQQDEGIWISFPFLHYHVEFIYLWVEKVD